MSERLSNLIKRYVAEKGTNGMQKLALESGISLRNLYKVRNEGHVPPAPTVYKLAKACGLSHEESLEVSVPSAKETA